MRQTIWRVLPIIAGGMLFIVASLSVLPTGSVRAERPMSITETSTAEPPTQTPTNTPTSTLTPTQTSTNTPTSTLTPTNTPTSTLTPTQTSTNTPTSTLTPTSTPTSTPTPTNTPTGSGGGGGATSTPTNTPTGSGGGGGATPTLTNTPTGSGGGGESTPTSTPTIVSSITDLALTKSVAPSVANVGDEVVYTLTLRNVGSALATEVTIDDPLPAFLSLIGANASSGTVQLDGNRVQVTIPVVAPGEQVVVSIQARLLAEPLPPENRNVATARTSSVEITTDNNTSSATILPVLPDLALTKSVAPSVAQVGDEVVYTLTLRNVGGAPANDVTLLDNLPSFLRLIKVTTTAGNAQSDGNQVTVTVPVVNPGETVVVQITAQVLTLPTDPDNVNVASVRTSSSEVTTDNNTSSAALTITTTPTILPQTGGHLSRSLPFLIGFALVTIGIGVLVRRWSLGSNTAETHSR